MKAYRFLAPLLAVAAFAAPAGAQQASITLRNSNMAFCHHNNTEWEISKTLDPGSLADGGDRSVTWNISATRGATSDNFLVADGYVSVTNTGSAPATIGNIVVNLQRRRNIGSATKPKYDWVSASADVSDATNGDSASSANIVSGASQEVPAWNLLYNSPATYGISGARGTFAENAGSGSLKFTDADNNTVWAITPEKTIAVGATVNLLFQAEFNNTVLGIPAGESLRAEIIVTFGNAGLRGGSGSTAANIDIDGDGIVNATDEKNVRSVPTRVTQNVPALEQCNDSVTLTDLSSDVVVSGDPGITTSGYVTDIGGGTGTEVISTTVSRSVSVDIACNGELSGAVTNTAHLKGEDSTTTVNGPPDPITGLPIYSYAFPCCNGVDLDATSEVTVSCGGKPFEGFKPGDFTTYTQGGWGSRPAGQNPGSILTVNFAKVYPIGVEIGIPGLGGFSAKFTDPKFITGYGTGKSKVDGFLPAGGTPDVFTADLIDPGSSSANVFGGQVLALQLNVDFSAAGITQGPGGPLGSLKLFNTGGSLDGQTISQILAVANQVIGGGALPAGYTVSTLSELVTNLNEAFDGGGSPTPFAQDHLRP